MVSSTIWQQLRVLCLILLVASGTGLSQLSSVSGKNIETTVEYTALSNEDYYGSLIMGGASYPPSSPNPSNPFHVGIYTVGQQKNGPVYYAYRKYVSFNTSALPDGTTIFEATLSFYKKEAVTSGLQFLILFMSGCFNVIDNADWDAGSEEAGSFNVKDWSQKDEYASIPISFGVVNKTGLTQLEFKSERDGVFPPDEALPEWVSIDNPAGANPPKLKVVYGTVVEEEETKSPTGTGQGGAEPTGASQPLVVLPQIGFYALFVLLGVVVIGGVIAQSTSKKKGLRTVRGLYGKKRRV